MWNRVTLNRFAHKSTRYYVDEFHLLLKEEQTAAYSVEIWKRFRKWGGIPTGITQNIKDLLASREIENIFENSDFIYMLNQASGDRQILAKQLNISPYQLSYVTNSGEGEGLLFYGNIIIPFKDRFDKNLKLYAYMTTKPEEVQKRKEEEEKAEAKAAQEEEAIRAFQQRTESWRPEADESDALQEDDDFEEVIPKVSKPETSFILEKAVPEKILTAKDSPAKTEERPAIRTENAPSGALPALPEKKPEAVRTRRPRKPFVWTPGELEDEDYWLDADLPEEPLDEENPDRRYILPDDDDEED